MVEKSAHKMTRAFIHCLTVTFFGWSLKPEAWSLSDGPTSLSEQHWG
jgi:hypothetical protein